MPIMLSTKIDVQLDKPAMFVGRTKMKIPSTWQMWKQEAFEKCWAHLPLRAVLHCHSPGVATVVRRLHIDVHDNDDDDNNDNA